MTYLSVEFKIDACVFGTIRINKNKVKYFVYVCYEACEARTQAVRQEWAGPTELY